MGLQARLGQDPGHHRVMNGIDDGLLDDDLLQRATIPTAQMQSIPGWLGAGDALNLDPLERGKKWAAARFVPHQ